MKKFIFGMIVGGIIFGTSVYAATSYLYQAKEVSYTPSDFSWNVGNVKEAIDSLKSTSGAALTDLKNTNIAKAVNANGDSLSSVINTLGEITNQGNKSFTINSTGSTVIPAGYYDGTGKITTSGLVKPSGTRSITSNGTYNVSGYESASVNVSGDIKHSVTARARALRNASNTEADPLTVYVELSVDGVLKDSKSITHHLGGDNMR